TTACDFDLDGDTDIYVANGFRSGDSCQDYCTTYWTHDIYTGTSNASKDLALFFADSMRELNSRAISWNGYEHNSFLLNLGEHGFVNVSHLFAVGFEYDSRAVVGADLDRDGRVDLLVAEYLFDGRGFELSLHVYRNNLPISNNWLGVDLANLNHRPIGAKVTVTTNAGDHVRHYVTGDSFLSQHPATLHFGLSNSQAESVQIRWPNGDVDQFDEIPQNGFLRTSDDSG
ncbi:MAG: ASPIC/UnbV domain-containing protein, partial [Planctomycetales bacterium]|nr:ASPIC/UnbV domain-containing protein [Planctomycetales bacterium]